MRSRIIQVVNKNGIEGYTNESEACFIVRGVLDSKNDIIVRLNSPFEINGGFESLDIVGLYDLHLMV